MKKIIYFFAIILVFIAASNAFAKMPEKISEVVNSYYTPALPNEGLETAYVQPDASKFRGYVVVLKGGIPAERARMFVSWDVYDYRGVVINLERMSEISTRLGSPYTYLQLGDVLAVTGIKYFNNTVYLKLMTPEVYTPEDKRADKHHSRVTVMLGFKFPRNVIHNDDAQSVISSMGEWIKPFSSFDDAKRFADTIRVKPAIEAKEEVKTKNDAKTKAAPETKTAPAPESKPAEVIDQRMKNLEEKIEAARRQMEEAEKEMQRMKQEKK